MLKKTQEKRRGLLSKLGKSFNAYNRDAKEPLANIVVVINGMAAFYELFQSFEERLTSLSRDANRYGIYFIVTAESAATLRMRLKNNFKQNLVLHFSEPGDYTSVLGPVRGIYLPTTYGRGLVQKDGSIFE